MAAVEGGLIIPVDGRSGAADDIADIADIIWVENMRHYLLKICPLKINFFNWH